MSVPKRGKKYKEVLERGCGGYKSWTDWGWEYDCKHDYDWDCDDCPIIVEQHKQKTNSDEVDEGTAVLLFYT